MGLILNCAAASRSGDDNDYNVLADGLVVGRIFVSPIAPKDAPWFWCLRYGYYWGQTPTHGTAATREAAMAAFAKSWRPNKRRWVRTGVYSIFSQKNQ